MFWNRNATIPTTTINNIGLMLSSRLFVQLEQRVVCSEANRSPVCNTRSIEQVNPRGTFENVVLHGNCSHYIWMFALTGSVQYLSCCSRNVSLSHDTVCSQKHGKNRQPWMYGTWRKLFLILVKRNILLHHINSPGPYTNRGRFRCSSWNFLLHTTLIFCLLSSDVLLMI